MIKYRITPKGRDRHWQEYQICELGISPGNIAHEGDKFISILDWASRNFEKTIITLSDTLYRFNFQADGMDATQAYEESVRMGKQWLFRNRLVLERYSSSIQQINHWDEWRGHKDYDVLYGEIIKYYQNDNGFRLSLAKDIEKYMQRKEKHEIMGNSIAVQENCRLFLLEEIVCYLLIGHLYVAAHVYPAADMDCFQYMRLEKTPENLKGFEKITHVRIALNRKKSMLTEAA
ncbi:MAG: hypothetical protein CO093_06185 [Alphaproteobacteria bacterium CG_4_9_14_3_um_filter_47_13]|nr:MAG: hypothetical protein CO093_06185 [Alphaproteobacteria bacterium CG_4_9_14_3_um_filter_47_13]